MIVLFWDVDGTLLTTGRAGIFAWEDALRDETGVHVSLDDLDTAGLTDYEVGQKILDLYAASEPPERLNPMVRRYEELLPESLPRRKGRVLPGVREVLERVKHEPNVLSMLLTGNTRRGAAAKLTYYGLDIFFEQGAFSDYGSDRVSIARLALERAQLLVGDGELDRMYVIGDTPHDIWCGQAIGARTIAIATGSYSLEDLRSHHPWMALEQLPDSSSFLESLSS